MASRPFAGLGVDLLLSVLSELTLGMSLGLVASLPFDAARIGGRFIDLFRGASAESILPQVGIRESAAGDLLFQLLLVIACSGPGGSNIYRAVWKSFALIPLGMRSLNQPFALGVVQLAGNVLATGLCIALPVATLALTLDGFAGVLSRISTGLNTRELLVPLRLLGGAAVLWIGLEFLLTPLVDRIAATEGDFAQLSRSGQ